MTNSQPLKSPATESPRVYLPGVAVLLFVAAPILLLFGLFLLQARPRFNPEWTAALPLIGMIMIGVGFAALMSALILEGVRSIAQQQLHIQRVERDSESSPE